MKKLVKLPSLSRVAPNAKATLEFPIGPTYERIVFTVTGGAGLGVEDIGRIDLLIDGKSIQTFKDLQRLIDINYYWNREADTINQFAIHLNRAELEGNVFRQAPGIGTADVQTMHIEMDILAAPTDITITAHAQLNPVRQNLGAFYRIREFPFSSSVGGQVEIDKLPRGPWYSAIHLFKADVTGVEVTANDVKVIDATKSVLERFQKAASPRARVPLSAKATHIDLILEGDLMDSLPTAGLQDFRIKPTITTLGAIDVITETIDTLA